MGFLSDFLFGKKDGPHESHYKSGQLKEKGSYKDGEPHGPFEGYSKKWSVGMEGHLQHGRGLR